MVSTPTEPEEMPSAVASLREHSTFTWMSIAVIALAAVFGFMFGPSLVRYIKMTLM